MERKSRIKEGLGFTFKYKQNTKTKKRVVHFATVEDFMNTKFERTHNSDLPSATSEIMDIYYNNNYLKINDDVKNVVELKNVLTNNPDEIFNTYESVGHYLRTGRKYTPDEIYEKISSDLMKSTKHEVEVDGHMIYANSKRYQTFFTKGLQCCNCGITGKYFVKERTLGDSARFHLNLYAVDEDGNEVLMTRDHIIPRIKGGSDKLDNQQTMCTICNKNKGEKDNEQFKKENVKK